MAEFVSGENIWTAAADGDLDRVKLLVSQGTSVNALDENGSSMIYLAASYGQVEVVEYLITQGADVNLRDPDGDTPLLACEDPEVFQLLLQNGADPNARNSEGEGVIEKAIEYALEDESDGMLRYIVESEFVKDPEHLEQLRRILNGQAFQAPEDDMQEGDEGEEEEEGN